MQAMLASQQDQQFGSECVGRSKAHLQRTHNGLCPSIAQVGFVGLNPRPVKVLQCQKAG